jgi:hypothetical protein
MIHKAVYIIYKMTISLKITQIIVTTIEIHAIALTYLGESAFNGWYAAAM